MTRTPPQGPGTEIAWQLVAMHGNAALRSCPNCSEATLASAWECVHCGWDLHALLEHGSMTLRCARGVAAAALRAFALEVFCSTPRIAGDRVGRARVLDGIGSEAASALAALGARRGLPLRSEPDDPSLAWKCNLARAVMVTVAILVAAMLIRPDLLLRLWLPPDDLAQRIAAWRQSGTILPIAYAGAERVVLTTAVLGGAVLWFCWSFLRDLRRKPLLAEAQERLPRLMQSREWLSSFAPVLRATRPSPRRESVAELLARYDAMQADLGPQLDHSVRKLLESAVLLSQAATDIEACLAPERLQDLQQRHEDARLRVERAGAQGPSLLLRQRLTAIEEGLTTVAASDGLVGRADAALTRVHESLERLAARPRDELANVDNAMVDEVEAMCASMQQTLAGSRDAAARLGRAGLAPRAAEVAATSAPAAFPAQVDVGAAEDHWSEGVWRYGKLVGGLLAAAAGAIYLMKAYSAWTGGTTPADMRDGSPYYAVHQLDDILRTRVRNFQARARAALSVWTTPNLGADRVLRLARLEESYKHEVTDLKEYLYSMEDAGTFRLIFQPGDPMFDQLASLQNFLIAEEQAEHPLSYSKPMVAAKMKALDANMDVLAGCLHVTVKFDPPLVRRELNECIRAAQSDLEPWP